MPFTIEERVRFRDVDSMGHVNNAVYFTYMESARTEYYVKLTGVTNAREIAFIVARASIDYRDAARMGDTVVVDVWPSRIGNTSFDFLYKLTEKKTGRLIAEGETVQVAFDYDRGEKIPMPDEFRRILEREMAAHAGT